MMHTTARSQRRALSACLLAVALGASLAGCDLSPVIIGAPAETEFAFTNFSKRFYAAIQVREHRDDAVGEFQSTRLLAPGAIERRPFTELLGVSCPASLDFRLFLYRRVNEDLPIGEDSTEAVDETPVVAGELLAIPACELESLVTFTVVNWDAAQGTARVRFAQGSQFIEPFLLANDDRFNNADGVWEVMGVDSALSEAPPPPLADPAPIAGRVTEPGGASSPNVVVVLRSRFRTMRDGECFVCNRSMGTTCEIPADAPCGFGEPIAFTVTAEDGRFAFDRRPAGGYQVEFFADGYSFRPAVMELETPIDAIEVVAERLVE